jgi:predicted metal-dependent peptidase
MLEERKLSKVKITLMRNPTFALYSGVMMIGKTKIDDNCPTAYTNGRDEGYGREFVKNLPEKELAFVVMHEVMHKMYRHLTTWKKLHDENHRLANCACDYVINLYLKDIDSNEKWIAMPRYYEGPKKGECMGLVDERFRDMNAKQVFDILKQEQQEKGDDGEGEGGEGFDEHGWEEATKGMSEEEKKQLAREVDAAIRQGIVAAKKAGKGDGRGLRDLEELTEPKVDWREVLRDFVKSTCAGRDTSSWRKPNRRFLGTGVYMPSMISEQVGHIVVAVDTSGSIAGAELAEFLSEVKGIADEVHPEQVDLLYWGSEVAAHEEYKGVDVSNIVNSTKPADGGGTSPSCITSYLEDKKITPECVIVLTDGIVGNDWGGNWTCPVLWAISGGKDIVAANGKTVHLGD